MSAAASTRQTVSDRALLANDQVVALSDAATVDRTDGGGRRYGSAQLNAYSPIASASVYRRPFEGLLLYLGDGAVQFFERKEARIMYGRIVAPPGQLEIGKS